MFDMNRSSNSWKLISLHQLMHLCMEAVFTHFVHTVSISTYCNCKFNEIHRSSCTGNVNVFLGGEYIFY